MAGSACDVRSADVRSAGHHLCSTSCDLCSASNYDPCSSAGHHYHCSSSRDVCSAIGIHNGSSACDVRSADVRSAGHHHCSTSCDLCSASNYDPCSSAGHHYHCSSSRDVCSVSGIHNGSS